MVERAKNSLLFVEAFHYCYHPFTRQALFELLSNEQLLDDQNIYELGNGTLMNLRCYMISMSRFIVKIQQVEDEEEIPVIISAQAIRIDGQIDHGMLVSCTFVKQNINVNIYVEFTNNWSIPKQNIIVTGELSTLKAAYLIALSFYHYEMITNNQTRNHKQLKTMRKIRVHIIIDYEPLLKR
ncbi:unnamed protein product [Didymodactylos carnosus]|uniref:Uncharacterized protein n=1 Tax=Didymodactylos carnosus TaxID=1234261 RepID=A0A813TNN7_9BILA|nr:unnamed protein product [Didymodactylos carnosus]CAF0934747.1 unnamed protein product [Didymodactylos carnosus]CAF3596490.1 unnamed protein product [Didymodactylos carnosus]CAF3710607.1 unnamed protein product [Didymodactylos carnosus]